MQTPRGALSPYAGGQPSGTPVVIEPTAMSGAKASAVFALGETLKILVHNARAFHSEADEDAAIASVEAFVNAHVTRSDKQVLSTGEEAASKEDVTMRVAPGGAPVSFPSIDYARLARSIVDYQNQQAAAAQQEQGQITQ